MRGKRRGGPLREVRTARAAAPPLGQPTGDLTNPATETLTGYERAETTKGDQVSLPPFEQVVAEHGPVVLRVCRAVVGPHDAEDAWAETFLAALRAYPRLRPDSDIRAWLVTIAHRKAIDRVRARQRAPIPVDSLPETASGDTEPRDPDPQLWQALAALPPKQRGAVAYHYVADLPYAQVGELLGTSEAAARRAAADGIASLRTTLGQETKP
jgi:RNA polymerase sigma factor (sigma-70 family)